MCMNIRWSVLVHSLVKELGGEVALTNGLDLLGPNADPSYRLTSVVSGVHRLLPYAIDYWIEHCLVYSTSGSLQPDCGLALRLCDLKIKHNQILQNWNTPGDHNSHQIHPTTGCILDDRLRFIAHLPIFPLVTAVLEARKSASQHIPDNGEGKIYRQFPRYCFI